jgi:hypothetical protein
LRSIINEIQRNPVKTIKTVALGWKVPAPADGEPVNSAGGIKMSVPIAAMVELSQNVIVGAALTAVAAISDTKIIRNMLFFSDLTPHSFTLL